METDRVKAEPDDMSADAACVSGPIVTEHESGNGANEGEDTSGFQTISMVFKWDSESACEVRNEPGHFEPISMVFKLGDNELPTDPEQKLQPPLVYILNHEKFKETYEHRMGSAMDVKALTRTFERLKCRVNLVQDPTTAMVNETIRELGKKDFAPLAGLVVIILSHGGENDTIVACDNTPYNLKQHIRDKICKIETLQGKPKILIVQACRVKYQADACPEEHGHYITCYSTSEGHEAYRNIDQGTIFIQQLCKTMDQDALTKDFTDIIKDVNVKTEEEAIGLGKTQKPSIDGILQPFCFGDYVNI